MTDPIGVRNILVQTSVVEKVQQVQQLQGDLQQNSHAGKSREDAEKASQAVTTARESDETRLKNRKKEEEKRRHKEQDDALNRSRLMKNQEEGEAGLDDKEGPGLLIDIKV